MRKTNSVEESPLGATDAGRRRLLTAIGWLPLVVSTAWALAGCQGGEEGAGSAPPQPDTEAAPPPASAGGGGAAPASQPSPPPSAPASQPSSDALVTEVAAMQPTVQALQYVNESAKPDQHCSICQFFTPKSAERGSCQLFSQGLVSAGGWCMSWTAKIKS